MWDEKKEGLGDGVQTFYSNCVGIMVPFTLFGQSWRGPGLRLQVVWMGNQVWEKCRDEN